LIVAELDMDYWRKRGQKTIVLATLGKKAANDVARQRTISA